MKTIEISYNPYKMVMKMSEGNKDTDVGGNAGINCSAKIKSTNG